MNLGIRLASFLLILQLAGPVEALKDRRFLIVRREDGLYQRIRPQTLRYFIHAKKRSSSTSRFLGDLANHYFYNCENTYKAPTEQGYLDLVKDILTNVGSAEVDLAPLIESIKRERFFDAAERAYEVEQAFGAKMADLTTDPTRIRHKDEKPPEHHIVHGKESRFSHFSDPDQYFGDYKNSYDAVAKVEQALRSKLERVVHSRKRKSVGYPFGKPLPTEVEPPHPSWISAIDAQGFHFEQRGGQRVLYEGEVEVATLDGQSAMTIAPDSPFASAEYLRREEFRGHPYESVLLHREDGTAVLLSIFLPESEYQNDLNLARRDDERNLILYNSAKHQGAKPFARRSPDGSIIEARWDDSIVYRKGRDDSEQKDAIVTGSYDRDGTFYEMLESQPGVLSIFRKGNLQDPGSIELSVLAPDGKVLCEVRRDELFFLPPFEDPPAKTLQEVMNQNPKSEAGPFSAEIDRVGKQLGLTNQILMYLEQRNRLDSGRSSPGP